MVAVVWDSTGGIVHQVRPVKDWLRLAFVFYLHFVETVGSCKIIYSTLCTPLAVLTSSF